MSDDDEDVWLQGLAGRIKPAELDAGRSPQLMLEAAALREFIRRLSRPAATDIPQTDAAREQQLLARARRQGLLSANRPRGLPHLRRVSLAAAAVLVLAVSVGVWRASLPPREVLRGVEGGTVLLEARDPLALRRELTDELHAAGVSASGYERLGRLGLDADLPQPLPPKIARILERHHIPIPTDGVLAVEIEARVPP